MKYEFVKLRKPVPYNEYFKNNKTMGTGTLWTNDYVVAIAYVNGVKFARVIIDTDKQKDQSPLAQAVEEIVTEARKKHPFPSTDFDDDGEDEDESVPVRPTRKSSLPADPDKLYYIQHEDEYLTPFISYAATFEQCGERCKEAAQKYFNFVEKNHEINAKFEPTPRHVTTSSKDEMEAYVKEGWVFYYKPNAPRNMKWFATFPKCGWVIGNEPPTWVGLNWMSCVRKGRAAMTAYAKNINKPVPF